MSFSKENIPWNKGLKGVQVAWNKGKTNIYSEEHRQRISSTLKAKGIKPPSRQGLSGWQKGMKGEGTSFFGKKHTEETKDKMREEKLKNPVRILGEANHKWKGGKATLSSRVKASHSKRRTAIAENGGSFTYEEWDALKEKYLFMCLCCKKQEPEINLSADHIIPVSKGGTSFIENIQPLCTKCNSKKHVETTNYKELVA